MSEFIQFAPPMPPENKVTPNDEINITDYILIVWQRKIGVLIIILAILIGSLIYNLLIPKTYESFSLVKIGKIKNALIESIAYVKLEFINDSVLKEILSSLNIKGLTDPRQLTTMFSIESSKDAAEVLQIKGHGTSAANAVLLANTITQRIIERHDQFFAETLKILDLEMEALVRSKQKAENDIKITQQHIDRLANDIKYYEKEIKSRADAKSEAQGRIVESYITLLANTKAQHEALLAQLASQKFALESFTLEFLKKQNERKYEVKPTSIEAVSTLPTSPIAPVIRKNLILSLIIACFIGILYAFIADFFSKNKGKFAKKILC